MRKILGWILCGVLLAGCAPVPGADSAPATAQTAATAETAAPAVTATPEEALSTALGAVKTRRLTVVLNGCIAYEVDSAGGSLKTAIAAADLVVFLAGDFVPDDLPGETAAQQGLLDDAGVTADFGAMDLAGVPEQLDAMNEVLAHGET